MKRLRPLGLAVVLACAVAFAACSSEPPAAPATLSNPVSHNALIARGVPGTYQLMFLNTALQPVTSLIAGSGQELVLGAHVQDAAGSPAAGGSVTFEYCSFKGLPPNDINRADEAPTSACLTGAGTWARLLGITVNASGNAYMNFGFVLIPRTVGFRFRYSSQRSFIGSGVSSPHDFTWVAGS